MTAMTFSTKRLVELAKAAVANKDAAAEEWKKVREDYLLDHKVAYWTDERVAQVKSVRDYLTKCLKSGVAPTDDGFVKASGSNGNLRGLFYSPPAEYVIERVLAKRMPDALKIDVTDYRALIETLESSDATHVSPNQLAILGFKSDSLRRLFRESLAAE